MFGINQSGNGVVRAENFSRKDLAPSQQAITELARKHTQSCLHSAEINPTETATTVVAREALKSDTSKAPARTDNPDWPKNEGLLRFTPYAWWKMLWMLHAGPTEVGGFGLCETEDCMLVTDFAMILQKCTTAHVEFDDDAFADYMLDCVERNISNENSSRIWIHTHPGNSPNPSGVDENTLKRCFGPMPWAIMFIIARNHSTYCRLSIHVGPGAARELNCMVEFNHPMTHVPDFEAWAAEYDSKVQDGRTWVGSRYNAYDSDYGSYTSGYNGQHWRQPNNNQGYRQTTSASNPGLPAAAAQQPASKPDSGTPNIGVPASRTTTNTSTIGFKPKETEKEPADDPPKSRSTVMVHAGIAECEMCGDYDVKDQMKVEDGWLLCPSCQTYNDDEDDDYDLAELSAVIDENEQTALDEWFREMEDADYSAVEKWAASAGHDIPERGSAEFRVLTKTWLQEYCTPSYV